MNNRYRLLLRVCAIVAIVVGAKFVIHFLGWEILSINPLFSGIIAANVFLMGFLLKEYYQISKKVSGCQVN
ncbi:MAG TPA: hypothetical protein VLN45_03770 [Ignavibacteriaceae bacterium]|nr:hypothetical protein [Ignavibacteriaceae bacterium]